MKPNKLRARQQQGFTLIELMVVLTVLGVMMAFAAPNFREYKRNSALNNTTNMLVSSIYRTRTEAMKEGAPAILEPTSGNDWTGGWRIYIDRDLSDSYTGGDDIVAEQSGDEIPSDYLTITNSSADGFVKFNSAGFPRKKAAKPGKGGVAAVINAGAGFGALTLTVKRTEEGKEGERYIRQVIVSSAGRVRSCRPDTDADCPVPGGGGGGNS